MDELIIRSLMAETTAEEERQLMRWRAAAPENDARYRSFSATWELAGHAWTVPHRSAPGAEEIIARAEGDRFGTERGRGRKARRSAARLWSGPGRALLAAAALAGLLLAGALVITEPAPDADPDAPYSVVAEQPRTIHLADGSAVHLAVGSTLEIDPARPRMVRLEGRAYFGIAHQPEDPFIVQSSAGQTRVLGTRFDLTARGDELTVLVVEGRVEVASEAGEAEVGAGEESRIVAGGMPVVGRADFSRVRSWLGNIFIFQNTPLSTVASELEAHFDRRIVLEGPALSDRTVTAVFADRSLEEILPALCRAVDARCVSGPDTVRFVHSTHPTHTER